MLALQDVSKTYRNGVKAVDGVSFSMGAGVLGLLGHNGAGKTSLMQMVATLSKPSAGSIRFRGDDIVDKPDLLRARLGYLPQDFGVYDNLSARELLQYVAALKGVKERGRIQSMLELVNLHQVADRPASSYSGGMRQRLGIAQALINDPDVIIVDEPTAGLDPEERLRFRNLLSENGTGKLVILSTHIVSDIASIATQLAVMKEGRLLRFDRPERLIHEVVGKVWQISASSAELEQYRKQYKVTQAVRDGENWTLRLVHPEQPLPSALPATPDLDDVFTWLMQYGG
ncbi:ABC transporter ATP-binding protein [Permianibacter sp. IMCC34836]|uniref:ABC transporter ATP-binding protein n=1 Tax=Permianibacter fluminis TaxID=2738515 RepID=UPI001555B332|nr:ABC transporter ATP-binding protein [Permianibacter fluminis]NQD38142.1 ABC transporter ATP-binding protein [Permianibacter fluminis]